MTTLNAEAAALAQRQIQTALSNALADASALQAENAALRTDARQLAERMHRQVVAATTAASQLETEVASRQAVAQELAAALEHASDERDTLLTEAAAASELRRRLAQATAERDGLSEQNAQLQREVQQLSAAVAEAEAMAGAALSDGRRLTDELAALRGGQTDSSTAAAAEAEDLRRQLELTGQELSESRLAAAEVRADASRCSAAAADARAEADAAAATAQARGHAAGLQRLLGASVLAMLHSLPRSPPLQQQVLSPPPPPLPPPPLPQQSQMQAADMPPAAAAAGLKPGLQPATPAVQSVLAAALLLRATDVVRWESQAQAVAPKLQHRAAPPTQCQQATLQPEAAQDSGPRLPLRPAAHAPARPCLPPRRKHQFASGSGQQLQQPPGTARKRPRLDARRTSATPSAQSLQSSTAARPADVTLPLAASGQIASTLHASAQTPDATREAGGCSGGSRKQRPDNGESKPADALRRATAQPPQCSPPDTGAANDGSGTDGAAAAGNAALLELLQHLQLEDRRRRDAALPRHGPVAALPSGGKAAQRHPHHGRAPQVPAAAAAAAVAAANASSGAAPGLSRQQWHADGRLRTAKHSTGSRSSGSAVQRPTLQRQPATKSAGQGSVPAQSLQLLPQAPSTKGARHKGGLLKPAASAPSRAVHTSRRRGAVKEPQSASAAATAPGDAPAAAATGYKEPPVLQPPPQPLPLSIAAKLSLEIAALDAQHGLLFREDAAARRAAGHAAGGPGDPAAETRVRSCAQLLAEVQAAMQERGAQLRSVRQADRPEAAASGRVAA